MGGNPINSCVYILGFASRHTICTMCTKRGTGACGGAYWAYGAYSASRPSQHQKKPKNCVKASFCVQTYNFLFEEFRNKSKHWLLSTIPLPLYDPPLGVLDPREVILWCATGDTKAKKNSSVLQAKGSYMEGWHTWPWCAGWHSSSPPSPSPSSSAVAPAVGQSPRCR